MTDKIDKQHEINLVYLIENKVYFYPHNNLLTSLDGDSNVKLLSTGSECLLALINKHGEIVPKEDFIENVWKKKGVIATEHTFYQTILTVRKGFSQLGLHGIIKTKYRIGLTIDKSVSINQDNLFAKEEKFKHDLQKIELAVSSDDSNDIENIPEKKVKLKIFSITKINFGVIGIIGVILGATIGAMTKIPPGGYFDQFNHLSYMGDHCQILTPARGDYESNKVQSFLEQKKTKCSHEGRIYYSAQYAIGRHSVIKCSKNINEDGGCTTYFYLNAFQKK